MSIEECIEFTKMRLLNSLKGQANNVLEKNSYMITNEERKIEMDIIKQFVLYIKNFEENQRILQKHRENKQDVEER